MKPLMALILIATLSACGADGEPVRPTGGTSVVVSNNGVGAVSSVGLQRGGFGMSLGLGL